MTKDASFEEWAGNQDTSMGRCSTCKREEWCDAIRDFLHGRSEGKHSHSVELFHKWMQERFQYPLSINTLRRHMRACEGDLYVKARIR